MNSESIPEIESPQTTMGPVELYALWRQSIDTAPVAQSWTVHFANQVLRRAVADGQMRDPVREALIAEAVHKRCHEAAIRQSGAAAHAIKQNVDPHKVAAEVGKC